MKGQTNTSVTRQAQVPLITMATDPTSQLTFPIETSTTSTTTESVSSIMTGHAIDPEVTRYRPTVRSGEDAERRGERDGTGLLGAARRQGHGRDAAIQRCWTRRAGPSNGLWLPNALSHVTDPFAGLDKDMLISGLTYQYDGTGEFTQLELAGRTAFDRINSRPITPLYREPQAEEFRPDEAGMTKHLVQSHERFAQLVRDRCRLRGER